MTFPLEAVTHHLGVNRDELGTIATRLASGQLATHSAVRRTNGSFRRITRPAPLLRDVLRQMDAFLRSIGAKPPAHVHGFVKGRSIVTNARAHLAKPVVVRIDIERFFESTSRQRVSRALENAGFVADAADLVSRIVTVDGSLPVGFPTSPRLSNLVLVDVDWALLDVSRQFGATLTRYADDITFSGSFNPDELIPLASRVLRDDGWALNEAKTQIMRSGQRQIVTGLCVNDPEHPRIPRSLKNTLRWKMHFIERVGYEEYMRKFSQNPHRDEPYRLLGLARHFAAVERELGLDYLRRLEKVLDEEWYRQRDDDDWISWLEGF